MTSKTSHTDFRVSTLADATALIRNVCFETCEAARTDLGVTHSTYTTARIAGSEASETLGTNFGIALLTHTTSRKVGSMRLEASEAACPNFCVAPSADSTPVEEAIRVASETVRTNLSISSATYNAAWWRPQVVDDASGGTLEAARANLGKPFVTDAASANAGINKTSQTETARKFAISSLTHGAPTEQLIKSAGETARADFLKSAAALSTARVWEMVVYRTRETA